MLDEYLKRGDVDTFIKEIKTNERYFDKNNDIFPSHSFTVSSELALYIFYDALYKYRIILNDIYLFDEYLEQLEKLYRKLDNFEDIMVGINKLICKMVIVKLDIKDVDGKEARKQILSYIHGHYIINGYFIHGFNTSYSSKIEKVGFSLEEYENYYDRFQKLNEIFAKYNVLRIVDKDFTKKKVYFTDDIIMGCYYSNYAPMFFYNFLTSEDYFGKLNRKDGYLIDNYDVVISRLKRFMSNNLFSENDKKYILDLVKDEWNLLHRVDKKISLLLVKRKVIGDKEHITFEECLQDDGDVYDIADRLLSSKNTNVSYDADLFLDDIEVITLDTYYEKEEESYHLEVTPEEEFYQYKEKDVSKEFLDVYGKASIFLILGSLFITLGVIITIIMVFRGISI